MSQEMNESVYVDDELSKNYKLHRRQTLFGFYLSAVFMALGMICILGFAFGLFGVDQDLKQVGLISSILSEFIAGSALLIYKLNFNQLNKTSDSLERSWNILRSYKFIENLPDEYKSKSIMKLVSSLSEKKQDVPKPYEGIWRFSLFYSQFHGESSNEFRATGYAFVFGKNSNDINFYKGYFCVQIHKASHNEPVVCLMFIGNIPSNEVGDIQAGHDIDCSYVFRVDKNEKFKNTKFKEFKYKIDSVQPMRIDAKFDNGISIGKVTMKRSD